MLAGLTALTLANLIAEGRGLGLWVLAVLNTLDDITDNCSVIIVAQEGHGCLVDNIIYILFPPSCGAPLNKCKFCFGKGGSHCEIFGGGV